MDGRSEASQDTLKKCLYSALRKTGEYLYLENEAQCQIARITIDYSDIKSLYAVDFMINKKWFNKKTPQVNLELIDMLGEMDIDEIYQLILSIQKITTKNNQKKRFLWPI